MVALHFSVLFVVFLLSGHQSKDFVNLFPDRSLRFVAPGGIRKVFSAKLRRIPRIGTVAEEITTKWDKNKLSVQTPGGEGN